MISGQQPMLAESQGYPPHMDNAAQMHPTLDNFSGQQADFPGQQVPGGDEEADPRKLCILGLPWDTTDETLQSYFSQFGPLEEATIIRKARTGESRGFGFVTYRSNADAQQVRLQEHSIGGRHCDAKQALPRGTANPSRETRLFVGRLPPSVTDAELKEHFERFGKVQDAYIPKDPATAKQAHRGFGFVTFADADDVDKVLSCAHSIGDQEIAVQCAIPKEKGPELIQSRGMSKWGVPALPSDSYPSSADSLTTIPVPGQAFYSAAVGLQGGMPQGMPGSSLGGYGGMDPSSIDTSGRRPYWSGGMHNSGAPSTSGRGGGGQAALPTGSSSGSLDRAHFDRLQFGTGSTPSQGGSRRSSVDYNVQRLGSNDSSMATEQSTIQALQGLTFGGSNEGIGIGLALLQARSQAASQAQVNQMDISRQAFPPLHHQGRAQSQMHPNQLSAIRNHANGAAAPRFVGQRLMGQPQPYLGSASPYGGSSLYPTPAGGMYGQPSVPYGVSATAPSFGGHVASHGGNVGPGEASAGPRMFVGKLNKETSEGDIKEYMTQFGYVLDVYMPRDKVKRNEHRGFGFVTFETPAAVQRVAQSGPHRIKGAVIVVDEAAPRREELPDTEDVLEIPATPSLPQSHLMSVISPTASRLGTGAVGGSASESSFGMNGITSPGSISHPGTSPTLGNSFPTDSGRHFMGQGHMFGQQHTTTRTPLMDAANNGLGPVRTPSIDANAKGTGFVQY